jgi:tetratricopeptide (TPR) repeat protein
LQRDTPSIFCFELRAMASPETDRDLLRRAQKVQKSRRWRDAEDAWREYVSVSQADHRGYQGLVISLMEQQRYAEAMTAAQSLRGKFPDLALSLLGQISARKRDWTNSQKYWGAVLASHPHDRQALVGHATAALALGELESSRKDAELLTEFWPDLAHGLVLQAQLDSASQLDAKADGTWHTAIEKFGLDAAAGPYFDYLLAHDRLAEASALVEQMGAPLTEAAFAQKGRMLLRLAPGDDHLSYWRDVLRQFPENGVALRQCVNAAVKAGLPSEALAAFRQLVAAQQARASDASLIIALANVLRETDRPAVEGIIRKFLAQLRGAPRRQAFLKLSRLIWSFEANTQLNSKRVRTLVHRSSLEHRSGELLLRVQAIAETLNQRGAMLLLDTDVSRSQCEIWIKRIHQQVQRGSGWAFVRLDDGEGNCVPYEPHTMPFAELDAAEREVVWWGRAVATDQRELFAGKVLAAANSSDCVGIPALARFLRDVRIDMDDDFTGRRTGRGLRAILAALESGTLLPNASLAGKTIVSSRIHQDIERWGLTASLMAGLGKIAIVSCHPNIAAVVRDKYGVETMKAIAIPPRAHSAHLSPKQDADKPILPQVLHDIMTELDGIPQGTPLIIGAGYLGKWIARAAKEKGLIALDLGSILDYWVGQRTRSILDIA